MADSTNLSPWAHPKASQWFDLVLERSGFVEEIEELLHKEDVFDLPSGRLLLSILAMLGRPGIWPERHRQVLAKAASRVNRSVKLSETKSQTNGPSQRRKPMTLQQHQHVQKTSSAIEVELEMVRRWVGMSNRKQTMKQPPTWREFWG